MSPAVQPRRYERLALPARAGYETCQGGVEFVEVFNENVIVYVAL